MVLMGEEYARARGGAFEGMGEKGGISNDKFGAGADNAGVTSNQTSG